MNQALAFGLLFGGGILLESALSGSSLRDVVQGHPAAISNQGVDFTAGLGNGVAGVGTTLQGAINSVGSSVGGLTGSGYVNPFAKATAFSPSRIDMGQDFSMAPGSPILAPGNSTVLGIMQNWYQGQPYVALRLDSGPLAGRNYYVAEQIAPAVHAGQRIRAGNPIGYYASHGTGIEMGWAGANWQQTLAQATGATGGATHSNTTAGQQFHTFLQEIGAL